MHCAQDHGLEGFARRPIAHTCTNNSAMLCVVMRMRTPMTYIYGTYVCRSVVRVWIYWATIVVMVCLVTGNSAVRACVTSYTTLHVCIVLCCMYIVCIALCCTCVLCCAVVCIVLCCMCVLCWYCAVLHV